MVSPVPPVAFPEVVTWELRDKSGTVRSFEQSELTIDGEVRLIQLANKTIQHLNTTGFPWNEISDVILADGSWDWGKASELLTLVVTELPEFVAESTCILFEISPFDEEGHRNRDYESDKAFIRRSIGFSKWIDLVQTFAEQNDYKRLARPFGLAMTRALEMGMTLQTKSTENSPSSPESIFLYPPVTDETGETSSAGSQPDSSTGTSTPSEGGSTQTQ